MSLLNLKFCVIATLIIYIPFHLFEEAMGNFPLWMYKQGYTKDKKISYSFWLAGNVFFFYPLLIIGFLIYNFGGEKLEFVGLGILIWGVINSMEHIVFTIKDKKVSPGLFTSLLFVISAVLGLIYLSNNDKTTFMLILGGVLSAIVLFILPCLLQAFIGNRMWGRFEEWDKDSPE